MTATDLDLARLGALVAADLDRLGYRYAGTVRRMARRLADPTTTTTTTNGCRGCGRDIAQPAAGGRREWCSEACRRCHRR